MHSGRRKLLVADDSPTIRKVVSLTFGDEGLEVVAVSDGAEALSALEDGRPPDVVLADVCMPGPDGYELCERVKRDARLRGVPVVLLVGTFEPFNEAEARRVGADTVLTKPFQSIRDLVSKVGSLLGGGSAEESKDEATRDERARDALPAQEPPRAAPAADGGAPHARHAPSFADFGADDELIEAKPADAFGAAAASDSPAASRRRRTDENAAPAERAPAFVESKDPDFFEQHFGTNGSAAHEPAAFEAEGDDAGLLTLEDEEDAPAASAHVLTGQTQSDVLAGLAEEDFIDLTEESAMHEQTPPQASHAERAATAAAPEDALLDLGQVDAPAAAAAAAPEDDDFILDLGLDDEPAPTPAPQPAVASARPDAPSAFAEAAHGEPRHSFAGSAAPRSFAQAERAESAPADADDAAWRDVVMQDGPHGFVFDAEEESGGGAPSGAVEPEVVPADEPVPAVVVGEFTDGSVEGDRPKPPVGQSAAPFVGAASGGVSASTESGTAVSASKVTAQEPSTAGYAVGEARVGLKEPLRADQLSPQAVDAIARRVVELMSDKVVREIAWEVVPELAELLIRQKLEEDGRS